jgi:hypothetical protein
MGRPEGQPLGRPRYRWEDGIEIVKVIKGTTHKGMWELQ